MGALQRSGEDYGNNRLEMCEAEAVTGLAISIASLVVSIASALVAGSSLKTANRVAEREQRDWKQRKWFDLYFKANEAYDHLDYFQANYGGITMNPAQRADDWNELMRSIRQAHSMAVVFPQNPATDELFLCTKFKTFDEAFSKERLAKLLSAVDALRKKALVDQSVLATQMEKQP